jgi:cation transport regulator ChaC
MPARVRCGSLIAEGRGPNGSAVEYLERTADALRQAGEPDAALEALRAA